MSKGAPVPGIGEARGNTVLWSSVDGATWHGDARRARSRSISGIRAVGTAHTRRLPGAVVGPASIA